MSLKTGRIASFERQARATGGNNHRTGMTPTWTSDDGRIQLYHADCLDVLPHLTGIDAVVTDPPYGIGFDYGGAHVDDPEKYEEFMRLIVAECSRIVDGGACFFWQGMLNAARWHRWFPEAFRIFAACKSFVQFRPTAVQWSFDPVIFFGKSSAKPSVTAKDWHVQSEAPFGAGRERINHPCPRPLAQVEYVVSIASSEGEAVLDPFMGSGTTGVACIRTGRRFIGVEKNAHYFQIAKERIQRELQQQLLPL